MTVHDLTSRIHARRAQERRDAGRCPVCAAETGQPHLSCKCNARTADGDHCQVCGLVIDMCALKRLYDGWESA
jgi:hypothetical protein